MTIPTSHSAAKAPSLHPVIGQWFANAAARLASTGRPVWNVGPGSEVTRAYCSDDLGLFVEEQDTHDIYEVTGVGPIVWTSRSSGAIKPFASVAAMAADTSLVAGQVCRTADFGLVFDVVSASETEIRNVVVASGVAGLQCHQNTIPGKVLFGPPRGGSADDWADLNTLMAAEAGDQKRTIVFHAGTYLAKSVPVWHDNTVISMHRGVRIVADATVPPFRLDATWAATTYAIRVNVPRGGHSVIVTSTEAPPVVAGTVLQIRDAVGYGYCQLIEALGAPTADSGGWRIDFASTALVPYTTAGSVKIATYVPRGISIRGDHTQASGAAERGRYGGFCACIDCEISGIDFDDDDGLPEFAFFYGEGALRCAMRDITVRTANSSVGIILTESSEAAVLDHVNLQGTCFYFELILGGEVHECTAFAIGAGTHQAGLGIRDAHKLVVSGGHFSSTTVTGILVESDVEELVIRNAVSDNGVVVQSSGGGGTFELDGVRSNGGSGIQITQAVRGLLKNCVCQDAATYNYYLGAGLDGRVRYENCTSVFTVSGFHWYTWSSTEIVNPTFVGKGHEFATFTDDTTTTVRGCYSSNDWQSGCYWWRSAGARQTLMLVDCNISLASRPAVYLISSTGTLVLARTKLAQTSGGLNQLNGPLTVRRDWSSDVTGILAPGATTYFETPTGAESHHALPNNTARTDKSYAVPATPSGNGRFLLKRAIVRLSTAITGVGTCVVSLGTTDGGQEFMLNSAAVDSTTPVGTVLGGLTIASMGSAMASANNYAAMLNPGNEVRITMTSTGVVTAGAVGVHVEGEWLQ